MFHGVHDDGSITKISLDNPQQGQRIRKSPPITIDRLRAMISVLPADSTTGLRDRAVLVLGFALMGRRSELVARDIGDLTFTADGVEAWTRGWS
ncbi:hypothetical protein ACQPYK_22665 [Streptosporangium sp. CA-135522]|uniref:hypothetical protein n=1 Tax=Streptosporangium sp. CA-135522 TaxID=3240072 RepID=UPI003D8CC933